MLIVIPVSHVDSNLAIHLAGRLLDLGGIRPHKVLLAFSKRCPQEDRKLIESVMAQASEGLRSIEMTNDDERGWPVSANSVFFECAQYVRANRAFGEPCWYFFEADNTPITADCFDVLEHQYLTARLPFMGVRQPTMMSYPDGRRVQEGEHMVGTGIYPPDVFQYCRLAKHLLSTSKPFDVFMQWELVPKMFSTPLIQHNWQTINYTRRGNLIVCEAAPKFLVGALPTPVRTGVVIVHGCKDGSLTLVLGS